MGLLARALLIVTIAVASLAGCASAPQRGDAVQNACRQTAPENGVFRTYGAMASPLYSGDTHSIEVWHALLGVGADMQVGTDARQLLGCDKVLLDRGVVVTCGPYQGADGTSTTRRLAQATYLLWVVVEQPGIVLDATVLQGPAPTQADCPSQPSGDPSQPIAHTAPAGAGEWFKSFTTGPVRSLPPAPIKDPSQA